MDASDQPTSPPAPSSTEPITPAPAPAAAPAVPAAPPAATAPPPPPPVVQPPVPPGPYVPAAAPSPWWHRRWVPIVGAIAAALVLLGVGWTAGYTMRGDGDGHRHPQYNMGP